MNSINRIVLKIAVLGIKLLATIFDIFPIKNRVVFMSRQSTNVSLNYAFILDEIKKTYTNLPAIICLSNPEIQGFVYFLCNSIKQLWFSRSSRICIVDGYIPMISIPSKRDNTYVIQLWHSLGAIKCFGYQSLDTKAGRSSVLAKTLRMHVNYDEILGSGPGCVEAYSQAFNYPQSKIKDLGIPLIDYLIDEDYSSNRGMKMKSVRESLTYLNNYKYIYLYAPTFRKGAKSIHWLNEYVSHLAENLSNDSCLLVSAHPLVQNNSCDTATNLPNVHFIKSLSTFDIMFVADCVITDYSSVAFEAGLLGRKVVFYVPDIDEYRQSPGLNIDPLKQFADVASTEASIIINKCKTLCENHKSETDFTKYLNGYITKNRSNSAKKISELIVRYIDSAR